MEGLLKAIETDSNADTNEQEENIAFNIIQKYSDYKIKRMANNKV